MKLFQRADRRSLEPTTSDLIERIQRLECEHEKLRARLESERQIRSVTANMATAAHVATTIGLAIERFAQSMREPIRRGRPGGIARARIAWRRIDGTFMPETAKFEARIQEYERYARGGRARARTAQRAFDGTFV